MSRYSLQTSPRMPLDLTSVQSLDAPTSTNGPSYASLMMSRQFLQFSRSDNTRSAPSKTYHTCPAWYALYFQELGVTLEQVDWPNETETKDILHFLQTTIPNEEQRYGVFPAPGPDQQCLGGIETDLHSHIMDLLHGYHLQAITHLAGYYMQTLPRNDTSVALNCSLGSSSLHGTGRTSWNGRHCYRSATCG